MVRLLLRGKGVDDGDFLVSIPQWCDCCTQIIQSQPNSVTRFNPTMVRLLLCIVFLEVLALLVSIPQWCDCCLMQIVDILSARKGFNPTMVRLLRVGLEDDLIAYLCFNPTMVRLLRTITEFFKIPIEKFQSHNGAIAASVN